ncbi:MAG TPA: TIM barrel protein, partial [Chloroflexota bacterium]|nr:TIM barrel protein [Chloroflexota bacterium]
MAKGQIRPTLHGSQLRGGKLSLEEKAALAQRYGYPGLDFALAEARSCANGDPAAVQELFSRYALQASTIGGVFGARLTDGEEEFSAALAQIPALAREAAAYGAARTGTVLPGRQQQPKEEIWPVVVERIRRVDDALEGTGMRLGIEFIGVKTLRPEVPHPFVQSMAEANRLLEESGARNVGLT